MSHGAKRVISLLVIFIAVGALIWLGVSVMEKTGPAQAPATEPTESVSEPTEGGSRRIVNRDHEEKTRKALASGKDAAGLGALLSPADFPERDRAERYINENQGKEEGTDEFERIVPGVLIDEDDTNIAYFATISGNQEKAFIGIYQFDRSTYEWERLYKRTDDGGRARMTSLVGREGDRLLLMRHAFGSELGACLEPILLEGETEVDLMALQIDDDASTGPERFRLTDEMREAISECSR